MKSGGIEDILIERGYETKKKKNNGIKVVIFLLIIVLALFIGAYYYLTNMNKISSKELFITNISKTNFKALFQKDIYTNIIDKIETKDFETETNVSFTTTLKNEELKNVDVSKITLEVLNENDVDNLKSFSEAKLKYAENEVFKLKALSNENAVAIFSNEIQDKYIGCNYENLKQTLNISYNNDLKKLKDIDNIDINEEEKNKYFEKYLSKIMENIPEEKFSVQENIVIQKAEESVDVTAYTVTLNKDETNNLIKHLLNTLKDDEEFLKEFAGKIESEEPEESNPETQLPVIESEIIPEENVQEEQTEEPETEKPETEEPEISETENEPQVTPSITPEDVQTEPEEGTQETNRIPVVTINPVGTIAQDSNREEFYFDGLDSETNELSLNRDVSNVSEMISRLVFGKKIDKTVKELQNLIDAKIKLEEYKQMLDGQTSDKGITVNIYASEEKTEKITINLPNEDSWDIEFVTSSEKDNRIKITYLQKVNNQRNGYSLDFNKIQNDANTTIKATYNVIENEKINKKIIVDLKTVGTANSKEIKNDMVLTVSTNKGETKVILDNTIKFTDVEQIEELVPENCLYLDQLSEEELKTTLDDLKNKFETLYNDKKESLNFINTNTGGITLEDISSAVKKDEAKNALITKVSNMMQEAIDNNQEFTIKNLENLTIDGYEVSSTVTEENAKIVVDIYTFNIDQNFTLTDVE